MVAEIYKNSGLNHPTDLKHIESMIHHANVKITAWDGDRLVGFLRAFTDYCFDCYLNDLAVDKQYQKKGIGKPLLDELEAILNQDVMILVLASKEAIEYYPRLGFKPFLNPNVSTYKLVCREMG
jgi:ribosomal protein S18 acetylase RimI-like enzyme